MISPTFVNANSETLKVAGAKIYYDSALEASKVWVVVGVGAESEGQLARRSALAMRMGLKPVTFPGGHGGYGEEPGAFAQTLEEVLATAN